MDQKCILPYVESIYRFCFKRLQNRQDAEDLAGEILCHLLEGMKQYEIHSLDAWVWRIAHNRYARLIASRKRMEMIPTEEETLISLLDGADFPVDEAVAEGEYEAIFRFLHTLSAQYRDIFVDYYLKELSIRALSHKYSLPETTIKWRLNVGRQKIRERIGEPDMEKVYYRINWNIDCGNGNINPGQYLQRQVARAICLAAYEKPLTVEEISLRTGIPTLYVEDELPSLLYGDAVEKIGNKYAANFILLRLSDREQLKSVSGGLVTQIADQLESLLSAAATDVESMTFYGHDFGMDRLGYLILPYLLRRKLDTIKSDRLGLSDGPFPPHRDGSYGWFMVEETPDEQEEIHPDNSGCNVAGDDSGSRYQEGNSFLYYYWTSRYFDRFIYRDGGLRWMCAHGIPQNSIHGVISVDTFTEEDIARLLERNLIKRSGSDYQLNFACFSESEFREFIDLFNFADPQLDDLLAEWILAVRKGFSSFVPARLDSQINQYVSGYLNQLTGLVTEELISRGALRPPIPGKPLVDGVFYVEGEYIDP